MARVICIILTESAVHFQREFTDAYAHAAAAAAILACPRQQRVGSNYAEFLQLLVEEPFSKEY